MRQEYERAARYRDMISTVAQLQEKQRMAAAEGDDRTFLATTMKTTCSP